MYPSNRITPVSSRVRPQSKIPKRNSGRSSSVSRTSEIKHPSLEPPRIIRSKSTLYATPSHQPTNCETTNQQNLYVPRFSRCTDRLIPSPTTSTRTNNPSGSAIKKGSQRSNEIDNRPFDDPKWQQTQLSKILRYLQQNRNVNEHCLRPLTIHTFIEVCNLLFGILDSKLMITKENYVEELPYTLRLLGYPSVIKKSLMKAVNIPRNWPVAIGILSWLVELVEGTKCLDYEAYVSKKQKIITKYIINSIEAWKKNHGDGVVIPMDGFYEELLEVENLTEKAFDEVKSNINELEMKYESLCAEETQMLERRNVYENNQSLITTMEEKITTNEKLKEQTLNKIKQLKINIAENDCILDNISKEKEQLIKKIETQSVNKEKYLETLNNCSALEQNVASLNKLIDNLKECTYGEELKLKRNNDRVIAFSEEFNKKCLSNIIELNKFAVYNITLTDPNAHELVLELKEKMMKTWEEQLIESKHLDLEVIELGELNKKMKELNIRDNEEIPKLKHANEALKEQINEIKKKIQNHKLEIEKLMKQIKKIKSKILEIEDLGQKVAEQSEQVFKEMEEEYLAYGNEAIKKLQYVYDVYDGYVNTLKELLDE